MRNFKKKIILFAIVMVAFMIPFNAEAKGKTKLNVTKKTVYVGKTYTVKLLNNKKKVKWSVSNKKIKIVKKTKKYAKIKAVKKGTVYLKARVGKKTYKCRVTVKNPKINKSSVTLDVGDKEYLKVIGTTKNIFWSSDNKKVANVDNDGVVTAINAGTATIIAKVGNISLKCKVKVNEIPVSYIEFSETTINVNVGQKQKLNAIIYPENATNKKIIWESSDNSILKVDNSGNIEGIKIGKAEITARAENETATCTVLVSKKIEKIIYQDENVRIYEESIDVDDYPDVYNINVTIENLTNKKIEMYMYDTSVNGYMVEPIFASEIMPNKKIKDDMTIFMKDVIGGEIKEMETRFRIYVGSSSFDGCYETDVIKIPCE